MSQKTVQMHCEGCGKVVDFKVKIINQGNRQTKIAVCPNNKKHTKPLAGDKYATTKR